MKTFSNNSLAGFCPDNPDIKDVVNKYQIKISELCEDFAKDCYEKNIEYYSALGWILEEVDGYFIDSCSKIYVKINNIK